MKFKEVVSVVRDLLPACTDIQFLSVTLNSDKGEFYYEGGPLALEDRYIFDACSQDIKREILRFYFSQLNCGDQFGWNVNVDFAK